MKEKIIKIFILFFGLASLISCDPPRYYDYFIKNNCNEEIEVKIVVCTLNCNTNYKKINEKPSVQINSNETMLIYSDNYFQPLSDYMVEYFFEEIIVTKGKYTSKINYIDRKLWGFRKTSKDHADSYLTVNPEDFE